jgi:hypothetical protein
MMIAPTRNAAISERARSNDFDRSLVVSSGGMRLTQTKMPCTEGFGAMPMARMQFSDMAAICLINKRQAENFSDH